MLWQIDLSGPLCLHHCSRCLLWLGGWAMRCNRLPVIWRMYVNHQDLRERLSPLGRAIEHRLGRVVTFLGSSASAAVRWDICKLIAQSQIQRSHTHQLAGTCSRIVNNNGTTIPHRETLLRPGPRPYPSECHTSGLHFIVTS